MAIDQRSGSTDRVSIGYAFTETELGKVLFAHAEAGVCCILFGDDEGGLVGDLAAEFPRAKLVRDDGWGALQAEAVAARVSGDSTTGLPLDVRGTEFQKRVWTALVDIPAGTTASYSEVARSIGAPKAARAVASACAANHIAVAIPCHRVVRGDGSLGGFKWGIERKRRLLDGERDRIS